MDDIFKSYGEEVAALSASRSKTEPSYYPAIKTLQFKMLERETLPFEIRASTTESRTGGGRCTKNGGGHGRPVHQRRGDVPACAGAVWRYELGGYPVIKKWLGYRDRGRRPDIPFSVKESAHLRGMVQRLAAVLRLHATLDGLYECACQDCFSAEELGL